MPWVMPFEMSWKILRGSSDQSLGELGKRDKISIKKAPIIYYWSLVREWTGHNTESRGRIEIDWMLFGWRERGRWIQIVLFREKLLLQHDVWSALNWKNQCVLRMWEVEMNSAHYFRQWRGLFESAETDGAFWQGDIQSVNDQGGLCTEQYST